jgi:hypothetical protein
MLAMKRASYWTTNLPQQIQVMVTAKIRGLTLGAAVEEALAAWLLAQDVVVPPRRPARKVKAEVVPIPIPIPSGTAGTTPLSGACRRCGHTEVQHWARGCLAGCVCRKFLAPTA